MPFGYGIKLRLSILLWKTKGCQKNFLKKEKVKIDRFGI
jgi:hypothetical protein